LALLHVPEQRCLEGVVSKRRRDAPYRSGEFRDWRKVKTTARREAGRDRWDWFDQLDGSVHAAVEAIDIEDGRMLRGAVAYHDHAAHFRHCGGRLRSAKASRLFNYRLLDPHSEKFIASGNCAAGT
jgi:hypothetical protein